MLVITFLGTVSGIPTKDRNHSAIVFEHYTDTKTTLLFDCGEGTQKQLMQSSISFMDIDNIFISHWHADHFAGLIPLIQTMNMEKRKKELTIFGPEAERFVADIIDLGYFGLRFPVNAINVPFEGSEITKIFESDKFEVLSIPTLHTVPSVAYCFKEKDKWSIDLEKLKKLGLKRGYWLKKLKKDGVAEYKNKKIKIEDVSNKKEGLKVVYTGDTKPCNTVVKISENADLLIHDGTFLELDEAQGKYHADVTEAAKIAKKANVKQLILTHISRRYNKDDVKEMEKKAREVFPNTKVAYDFMKIELK
ncbi:MAG: ribonuclease Z [Candidatus Aenigmatarchaeota archaeon]|nr:ribonuclease Z [Candidatus Aenigmarchaeota archaeon]